MTSDTDRGIENHIEALVAEEHELLRAGERHEGLTHEEHQRLSAVKVELDRYWDLLRRRRSAAEAGGNPDDVRLRSEGTVEGYLQ